MLIIDCPFCGPRGHDEFTYGGDAGVARPNPNADVGEFVDYVYFRDNPRGVHHEYWHHVVGCRQWLRVLRDTRTHEIHAVVTAAAPAAGYTA